MGWVMTMEEVVIMGPLGRVVVLVGHRCWWRWWSPVYNWTRVRSMVFVVMRTVAWNYWSWWGWCLASGDPFSPQLLPHFHPVD